MYNIIPPIIVILSLGVVLVIFLKKIVAASKDVNIHDIQEETPENSKTMEKLRETAGREIEDKYIVNSQSASRLRLFFKNIVDRLRLREINYSALQFLEKMLRRIKVNLMKVENIASGLTKKLSKKMRNSAVGITKEKERNGNDINIIDEKKEVESKQIDKDIASAPKEVEMKTTESGELTKEFIEQEKELIYRIAKNHADIESYLSLGELYMGIKNYDDAKQSFEHALKINHRDKKAKSNLKKIEKAHVAQ